MAQTISLNYQPRAWQRECNTAKKRFTVLALHRRAGKTELAIMELLDQAMRATLELSLYAYVAPFLNQAKAIAWARLKKNPPPPHHAVHHSQRTELTVTHNGAVQRIVGADNPDALRGVDPARVGDACSVVFPRRGARPSVGTTRREPRPARRTPETQSRALLPDG